MNKLSFALGVAGIAILHFVTTFMLTFITGTTGGGPFLRALLYVLTFPLSALNGPDNLPPLVGWGIWIGLSFAWGFAICAVFRRLGSKR